MEKKEATNDFTPIAQPDAGGLTYTNKDIDEKFNAVNVLLFGVVIILLVMVATLLIDSFHINSVTYKEYSERTALVENTQKINETLLKKIQDLSEQNKQDRETIRQLLKK
ncbi:MAG: hypothetical protein UV20_C0028G0006 [Candidatus Magasanikbacteria bacterium GW2011_GWA2_42_32]|uniref:Uncharacterized protein n=1 Tax=Candidatus Magasanikbacteria bacterium GW2011_GWA2_42_32 TaxID=1619039 RepID=A0A0G1CZC2_9BACT|nr:MAG: hypothetical protein UV20_C0028G0006 [Candidatus Magasanikbacteria bacterium GW2011_GWA2_42_32]